ncbi:polyprotein [Dioscorea mosaic virus]|uniref:Genome polyprotein n=1 Tax=Dioscorea mosaic virus TaxID=2491019 RepID=A0A3G6V9C4_9POTV|nr:polyprotein [Dioscorea mosaic virus]AZB50213.1 polyprotein [Dioscorea mosaic virus]
MAAVQSIINNAPTVTFMQPITERYGWDHPIQFGSLVFPVKNDTSTLANQERTTKAQVLKMSNKDFIKKQNEEYKKSQESLDAYVNDITALRPKCEYGRIKRIKGIYRYVEYSAEYKQHLQKKIKKAGQELQNFMNAPDSIIEKIDEKPYEKLKNTVKTTKERMIPINPKQNKRKRKHFKATVHANVESIMKEMFQTVSENVLIEVIWNKGRKVLGRKFKTPEQQYFKIETKHEHGIIEEVDCPITESQVKTLSYITSIFTKGKSIHEKKIKHGWSGCVIPKYALIGDHFSTSNSFIIVRGRSQTLLIDSAARTPIELLPTVEHYSAGERFWAGFDKSFRDKRRSPRLHEGTNTLDVSEVGSVAAIVCQSMFPCCRITCTTCLEKANSAFTNNHLHELGETLSKGHQEIIQQHPTFSSVALTLLAMKERLCYTHPNRDACGKIQSLIGDRSEMPFSHVLKINECLIKGSCMTAEDTRVACEHLLEIARWMKNRTDTIKKGSLAAFRNKISSKTHINLSLMCDNQLDEDGNFVWGSRGYHAKRFFTNYFNVIEPGEGYERYVERRNPHGSRKLAINNLILSTNLQQLRKQLEGEPIEIEPITTSCISKRNDAFIYPCCCVTHEGGEPVLSEVESPARNHLVIGNTGNAKYLDLPTEISEKLYIAKEGYCYINIFLAMLVSLDKKDAKYFTKWVRDVIANQLQTYPTLTDVALACHQVSILFPQTRSAELPRILIDHKNKMMHVVDSFGSITTGYHILKANTVSQLILFASDSLESEMKSYQVGGCYEHKVKSQAVKLLIKGIYRPNVLKSILEEDPYILMLAIISPSVLVEMYRSSDICNVLRYLNDKDIDVLIILTMLQSLAMQVSRAKSFMEKMVLIDSSAPSLLETLQKTKTNTLGRKIVLQYLSNRAELNIVDKSLIDNEFKSTGYKEMLAMEKIYKQELEHSYLELNMSASFSITLQRYKWLRECNAQYPIVAQHPCGGPWTQFKNFFKSRSDACVKKCERSIRKAQSFCVWKAISVLSNSLNMYNYLIPQFAKFTQVIAVIGVFLPIYSTLNEIIKNNKKNKQMIAQMESEKQAKQIEQIYDLLTTKLGQKPTQEEFLDVLRETNESLHKEYTQQIFQTVEHQASNRTEQQRLEQIVAFVALVMMMFDANRSDCVYRILNKLKTLVSGAEGLVIHQNLDDIVHDFEVKETVDFELQTGNVLNPKSKSTVFSDWWDNQLQMNNVIPHYRTEGHFIEFTRATAVSVCDTIVRGEHNDILLRGAVGSGKSTNIPHCLSRHGHVLLIEPTRPLVENVFTQLRGSPFFDKPTMLMRHSSSFGSSPITIMTSGYALHYLANNRDKISQYTFIIFDECHVSDANAMAFRCLLADVQFGGKLIKVSATPPGREVELKTQFPVQIKIEDRLSFEQFVAAQGTKSNADVISNSNNILVYVASYNQVDEMSQLLSDKGYKVTKVDGRTMKSGVADIQLNGTEKRKHFVVATNIIENGVTLDIDAVVDFGTKVTPSLNVENRLIAHTCGSISYGERIQRIGRVGRHKPGTALRIGHTTKQIEPIPTMVATEAAFLCFMYGLPVMTAQVSTTLLGNATVHKARTMKQFELPTYFMVDLVHTDGSMHPAIYDILKKYVLKAGTITLNKHALPHACLSNWFCVRDYCWIADLSEMEPVSKIPFYTHEVPGIIYEKLWKAIEKHQSEVSFPKLTLNNATKIAYKLRTDPLSVQHTIRVIDELIASEQQKKAHFDAIATFNATQSTFSISSTFAMIRSKYAQDYSTENIHTLQLAKAQLLDFSTNFLNEDGYTINSERTMAYDVMEYTMLDVVNHQNADDISRTLQLKGRWNYTLMAKDAIITCGVAVGAAWLLYENFVTRMKDTVEHQGKKRRLQKLKFREARDRKVGTYVDDMDTGAIEQLFGTAYGKKNKGKGTTHGMGKKTRRFVNMYGFDPTEYSFVRFLDPITGETKDESTLADILLVQEHFDNLRHQYINDELIEGQQIYSNPGIKAYFVKNSTSPALEVDLTQHKATKVCDRFETIAGFPEREGELRQTGKSREIPYEQVPAVKESVSHEMKAINPGLRDYNIISRSVCQIINESDGHRTTVHAVGFGPMLITNRHIFKHNNGALTVRSHHGEFICKNSTALRLHPIQDRDIVIIQMPKDFPPFPMKLKFRPPRASDQVVLVGNNFQEKHISSVVSSASAISFIKDTGFCKHWITTKDGHCGLPLVAQTDMHIVGLHSLASIYNENNYMTAIVSGIQKVLFDAQAFTWVDKWLYNPREISWGPLQLQSSMPAEPFKVSKVLNTIYDTAVVAQCQDNWVYNAIGCNLKAVGRSQSQLVTKHIVKGECQHFQRYLGEHEEAKKYFNDLLSHYGKSKLNKAAYIKDIMKYATQIEVGLVNSDIFEQSVKNVIQLFKDVGFKQCEYITDAQVIFQSLNMDAAMGAMYRGKKKEYLTDVSEVDMDAYVKSSCLRLFTGKMGIWNGSIKAELRPIEKIKENKTRTFTAAPLDTLLGGKVCVDDFNNQFYSLHTIAPWSVGISKFNKGWDKLLKGLPEGWIYCDADGSRFDSSLTPYLINAVLQLRLSFMEEWDIGEQMLRNLYTEIIYTPILTADGTIVKKYKGNNSGQPSTVVDNTIMVLITMQYSLLTMGITYDQQHTCCRYFANGDDLMIAVAPGHEYILDKLSGLFSELGLSYDFSNRHTDRSKLWFMSHQGIFRDHMYIPKLEKERIVSILEWNRTDEPAHRLEAICAAMIEAWGYDDLLHEIRKFYSWLLQQPEFADLAKEGKAPYISEIALRRLYTDEKHTEVELFQYLEKCLQQTDVTPMQAVCHQSGTNVDAGSLPSQNSSKTPSGPPDKDVNVGTSGTYSAPRLKVVVSSKLRLPKVKGKEIVNLDHLLQYSPSQEDISNAIATHEQFANWHAGVQDAYGLDDEAMKIICNGLMVWCIENGTSPNINGVWTMMDGEDQVTYPLKPVQEYETPTFRQIMGHFSDLSESYIEKQNAIRPYMPRYGRIRNLTDYSLARYAFDFYVVTSKTPARAREVHFQMKAGALRGVTTKLFGIDGKIRNSEEDTEHPTSGDVSRNMPHFLGERGV